MQGNDLTGVWEALGYGRVLAIAGDRVQSFDLAAADAVLHRSAPLPSFLERIDRIDRSRRDRLSHYTEGGITRYEYRRLDELPQACAAAGGGEADHDPVRNFEFFWHSFNENYAFFAERGVDWGAVRDSFRPAISAATSQQELYRVIVEIIDGIDDRHVLIQRPGEPCRYSGHPGTLARLLQRELAEGANADREGFTTVAKRLIADEYLRETRREAVGGQFTWGWAAPGIGYLSVDSMEHYVDPESDPLLRRSHRLVDEVMDRVVTELGRARGIIVDARWNGGGFDSNALHIAGHFTDRRLLAFTKCARRGDGYLPAQEVFIPWHAREVYTGPVAYLCGRDTLSAAEIFSLAMGAIPNVTSVGESTVGSLSDTHSIRLPNRWRMQVSNERYLAVDGCLHEARGVPVDVACAPREGTSLRAWLRDATDAAITLLQSATGGPL